MKSSRLTKPVKIIGWREWVGLPELGVKSIKAKVDTGARSSSLHAFDMVVFKRGSKEYVNFKIHPIQKSSAKTKRCEARVMEYRQVKSSNGHTEKRPVILTTLKLMGEEWPIELTLTNRDEMGFRMLLGRESFRRRYLVDAGKSYYGGQPLEKKSSSKKKKTKKKATVK
ncbi:MAG: hypothetical protein CL677_02330 [Bdellovibrionaceae bacterium]|nr:hypothetical protein [Pseudobdellovibrionaceae bacterium]